MGYHFSDQAPQTEWLTTPGKTDREMRLLRAFGFYQSQGRDWITPAGEVIDGASIPRALWSYIGSPYAGYYRRASIVHDHACREAGNDAVLRKRADRMFYDACRAGGCNRRQAVILYLGVRIGAWWSGSALTGPTEDDEPALDLSPIARTQVEMFRAIGNDVHLYDIADVRALTPDLEAMHAEEMVRRAADAYFARRGAIEAYIRLN